MYCAAENMKNIILVFAFLSILDIGSCEVQKYDLQELSYVDPKIIPFYAIINTKIQDYYCGGILISQSLVITPAKCVFGAKNITVYLGSVENTLVSKNVFDTDIIIHELYRTDDSGHGYNNIALLKLAQPVIRNEYISPIKILPNWDRPEENEYVTLAGLIGYNKVLMTKQILVRERDSCSYIFGGRFLRDQELCAKTAHLPDFLLGSPVTYKGKLLGFREEVSGKNSAYQLNPMQYEVIFDVSLYINWISEKGNISTAQLTGDNEGINGKNEEEEAMKAKEKKLDERLNRLEMQLKMVVSALDGEKEERKAENEKLTERLDEIVMQVQSLVASRQNLYNSNTNGYSSRYYN